MSKCTKCTNIEGNTSLFPLSLVAIKTEWKQKVVPYPIFMFPIEVISPFLWYLSSKFVLLINSWYRKQLGKSFIREGVYPIRMFLLRPSKKRPVLCFVVSRNSKQTQLWYFRNYQKYLVLIKFLFSRNNHSDSNFNQKFDYKLGTINLNILFKAKKGHFKAKQYVWRLKRKFEG